MGEERLLYGRGVESFPACSDSLHVGKFSTLVVRWVLLCNLIGRFYTRMVTAEKAFPGKNARLQLSLPRVSM